MAQRNRCDLGDNRSQVCSGRVSADSDAICIATQFGCIGMSPTGGLNGVTQGCRKRVLGGETVIDAEYRMAAAICKCATHVVV